MAVGARRLAKQVSNNLDCKLCLFYSFHLKGVIVCKLTALLDLASMKTLCSDKTGTLTKVCLSNI